MKVHYIQLDPYVRYMTEEERRSIVEAVATSGLVEISSERLKKLRAQVNSHLKDLDAKFAKFEKNNF